MRSLSELPPRAPQPGTWLAKGALVGEVLPSNFRVEDSLQPLVDAWDEPDAVADIAFAAGLLEGGPAAWARAARLGMSGLASYVTPVIVLSLAAALAGMR